MRVHPRAMSTLTKRSTVPSISRAPASRRRMDLAMLSGWPLKPSRRPNSSWVRPRDARAALRSAGVIGHREKNEPIQLGAAIACQPVEKRGFLHLELPVIASRARREGPADDHGIADDDFRDGAIAIDVNERDEHGDASFDRELRDDGAIEADEAAQLLRLLVVKPAGEPQHLALERDVAL